MVGILNLLTRLSDNKANTAMFQLFIYVFLNVLLFPHSTTSEPSLPYPTVEEQLATLSEELQSFSTLLQRVVTDQAADRVQVADVVSRLINMTVQQATLNNSMLLLQKYVDRQTESLGSELHEVRQDVAENANSFQTQTSVLRSELEVLSSETTGNVRRCKH